MIQLTDISKSFQGKAVIDSVSFSINQGDKIGIIGKNGAGKTTLLRIVAGLEPPDEGRIVKSDGFTVGYLPQKDITLNNKLSVIQEVKSGDKKFVKLFSEMEEKKENDPVGYAHIVDEFLNHGGYEIEAKAAKILVSLGFKESDFNEPVSNFSGGWQKKIQIAKLLLSSPSLLLLDEPTNNLDAIYIEWFIEYLNEEKRGVVVVSHDRYFLNGTTDKTWELSGGRLYFYNVPYSKYVPQKQAFTQKKQKEYEEALELISRYKRYVEKNRYNKKTAGRARSREKMLERIVIPKKPEYEEAIEFKIQAKGHLPGDLLIAKDISKSFGSKLVIENVNLIVKPGDRICILGENGSGKTTLLRILAGKLTPDRGEVFVNQSIETGYFSQIDEETLDEDLTPWDMLLSERETITYTEIYTLLSTFDLSEEKMEKKIKYLSGGERSRLRLLILFSKRKDLLILDEVTNHLDLHSREALEDALLQYRGGLVFVSHDRYFIEKIAGRYFIIENNTLRSFIGDYKAYMNIIRKNSNINAEKSKKKTDYFELKERQRQERKKRRHYQKLLAELAKIEDIIESTEAYLKSMEKEFENPDNVDEKIFADYQEKRHRLEDLYRKWEHLNLTIEEIERAL